MRTALHIFEQDAVDPKSSKTRWDVFFAKPFRGAFIQLRKDSFNRCAIAFERKEPPQDWTFETWTFKSWGRWADVDAKPKNALPSN